MHILSYCFLLTAKLWRMFAKTAMDSDDELPSITFSCSSNVPSEQKNDEEIVISELSNDACRDTVEAGLSDVLACSNSPGVVVLDSDSTDSDPSPEFTSKYSRSLRERCNASTVLSSADYPSAFVERSDLQLHVDLASVTDSQSCCNSLTDDSPAAFKSCENSEELALKELSQRTASDMNSQSFSVQSDNNKRRKRPAKADDPEAVVLVLQLIQSCIYINPNVCVCVCVCACVYVLCPLCTATVSSGSAQNVVCGILIPFRCSSGISECRLNACAMRRLCATANDWWAL